ncbi:MAG: hypothetical protein KTR25_11305 [Myxococcales bacterium]|nr:hypothetical protein [Myxococcales bacterium]
MNDPEDLENHDYLARLPLSARGWSVDDVPWRQAISYEHFDVVVVRSTWDYLKDTVGFLRCLTRIDRSRATLENPLSVIRWNLDKKYLLDIGAKGFPIIPTFYADDWDTSLIDSAFEQFSTNQLVIKPTVGAGAKDTLVLTPSCYEEAGRLFQKRRFMIQPFIRSIVSSGEISLFYFDGELSHVVEKKPRDGDFRVQEEHGGHLRSVQPDSQMQQIADRLIEQVANDLLYARVDMVWHDHEPMVMELELIEPSLYLNYDADAPYRFAEALHRRHRRRQNS